jgi:outer membrane protein assembly factor BamB
VLAIVLLAACGLAWIWMSQAPQRQARVVGTLMLGLAVAALVLLWGLVWLLFLSRLRWLAVLSVAGTAALLLAASALSVRVRGVSGDVVPILEWRLAGAAAEPPRTAPAAVGATPSPSPFDYPQFLGPSRNGTLNGVRLDPDWEASPPRPLWRIPVGAGWSGFAVVGELAVTHEQRGPDEVVACYEVGTGRLVWSHADRTRFDDPVSGPGPRATPAIHGTAVYALGATGLLSALDLATGRLLWSRNILEDNDAQRPAYGVSASPLVFDDRVVVAAGGTGGSSLVAYHAATGERLWGGGDDPPAYSSPLLAELVGERQILILNGRHLAAHEPAGGRVLWRHAWPAETEKVSQPVVLPGDRVFTSTGYGVGGRLLRVQREPGGALRAEQVWASLGLRAKFTNVLHRDGFLYGLDDGILVCLDLASGARRWKGGRYGHGQVILLDQHILVLGEAGGVALVEAEPRGFRELGRFQALEGKTWNHPALAGARLLVRNDREAACYALAMAPLQSDTGGRRR